MNNSLIDPRESFSVAAEMWFKSVRSNVHQRTAKDRRLYLDRLVPFFGDRALNTITLTDLFNYQNWRKQKLVGKVNPDSPGHVSINKEISTLRMILDAADLWACSLKRNYRPLRVDMVGPGQALSPQEKLRLFELGAENPRWSVALHCAMLAANTAARAGEIRTLRLRDIDLNRRTVTIRRAVKNKYVILSVPLNDDALVAVNVLLARANAKGCRLPEHCLLPHRAAHAGDSIDPTLPMGTWKKAWAQMVAQLAKEFPDRGRLRFIDLRHTAIAELYSKPENPPEVVKLIAGKSTRPVTMLQNSQEKLAKTDALSSLSQQAGNSLRKQQQTGMKKQFHVYLEISNYQKLSEYANRYDTTLGLALNEIIRTFQV